MRKRIIACVAVAAAVATAMPAAGQRPSWVRQFDIAEGTAASAVAVDATGVLVAGVAWSTWVGAPEGPDSVYIRRYDLDGAEAWTRLIEVPGDDWFPKMAVDATGVYVAAGESVEPDGETNYAIRRYDTSGSELWRGALPGQPLDLAAIADAVYVVGFSRAAWKGYLRKYDLAGVEQWTRLFWAGHGGEGSYVAASETGAYVNTNRFGIRAYDPDGDRLWAQRWNRQPGILLAVGSDGVYAGGAGVAGDVIFRKYDLEGVPLWKRRLGTPRYESADGLHVDDVGIYVLGETGGTFPAQTRFGGLDGFVAAYAPDGTPRWTTQFGTERADWPSAATTSSDGLFVIGQTNGTFEGADGGGHMFVLRMLFPE